MSEKKASMSFWLFAYGFVMAFFHVLSALMTKVWASPVTSGDAPDFLTPLAVIPVAYFLYRKVRAFDQTSGGSRWARIAGNIALALGFLLYVDGHGIHLSANSISRLLENEKSTAFEAAVYLWDEVISHFMWDGGVVLISIALILLAAKKLPQPESRPNFALLIPGAAFYGFNFSVNGIEGQTVIFTFPAACVCCILALILYFKGMREGTNSPVFLFFAFGYFLSVILFAYWGIARSGFPEFSALGWIK